MKPILNITQRDFDVLHKIFVRAEGSNKSTHISYKEFQYDMKSFFQRIKKLEKLGLLKVIRRTGFKNMYQITQEGEIFVIKLVALNS